MIELICMKRFLPVLMGLIVLTPLLAYAYMPQIYPVYGYNSKEHICQIKQRFETSQVQEELDGEYWNLRECRWNNPEILFYTGFGIVLWILIFVLVLFKNFYIAPIYLQKKFNTLEKKVGTMWDSFLIFSAISIMILLLHYFSVPFPAYYYASDIDRIIYSILIDRQIPFIYLVIYILASAVTLYLKKKRLGRKS